MLSDLKKNSEVLCDNEWVSLLSVKIPSKDINGYTYSHETRCNGNIVAFLPFKFKDDGSKLFLIRKEAVPCWELDSPILTCFTGGLDKGLTPVACMEKELEEEAGYKINDKDRIIELMTSYATKSCDTVYHLFAVDLTDFPEEDIVDLTVESDLEKKSTNVWVPEKHLYKINDPFVALCYLRLQSFLD